MSQKVYMESLGCTKNLIDAEIMLGLLKKYGYQITEHIEDATVAVINTCGFIESAKEESIERILSAAGHKKTSLKKLVVTGCLSERYHKELLDEMPEIDGMIGTGRFEEIAELLENVMKEQREVRIGQIDHPYNEKLSRIRTSASHMAYVKISDGCDHYCAYCIIPKLRGSYRSRGIDSVVDEVKLLAGEGVREIILIAQDTTSYGVDRNGCFELPALLRELEKIDGIRWIRLMYCYPERITRELLTVMQQSSKICAYLDLPIQHSENSILKRMNRKTTRDDLVSVISLARKMIPGIVIRTTLIVGFPGETEEEFEALKSFVKTMKFDKLGVFTYSREENTPAALMENQIPQEVKEKRQQDIMQIQQKISGKIQRAKIGSVMEVLIEEALEVDGNENTFQYAARTYGDAPEIDGLTYIASDWKLEAGEFVNVRITDAMEYDLMGVMADETKPRE